MIYLERVPAAPLDIGIRMLWYARAPVIAHSQERILPNGCAQIILNLARDFISDDGAAASAILVGPRSKYEIVDTSDMTDLIAIMFRPGALPSFISDRADLFENRTVPLEDLWGSGAPRLREQLQEAKNPCAKLTVFENALREQFAARVSRNPLVDFALLRLGRESVEEVARQTGWSVRRFSAVFHEQVGLSPKVWSRLQRFQGAVRQLHSGTEIRWSDLAVDCGYYDQSHFANDFRAFSGINPTTYTAQRTRWANHVFV
jgi:AraC-like DNA-binding protein